MKVLLIVPPGQKQLEVYQSIGVRAPPLGLAWMASILERNGHEVKILDSPTLNLSIKEITEEIKSWSPELIGLTSVTPTIYNAYKVAKLAKEIDESAKVVIGGPHVTFMYREVLEECPYIDYACMGEGEYTLLELVNTLKKGDRSSLRRVRGLALRDEGGRVIVNEPRPLIKNLDELPPPARHLLPMNRYTVLNRRIRLIHVMASRGCPYGCIFCSTSFFFGRKVRFRSPKCVLDEIEEATSKYKTKTVVFTDDEFTISRKWIYEFLRELRSRRLDIQWTCGSRVDTVNREILTEMFRNGCLAIYFGVESGKQSTLDKIRKRISISQIIKAFRHVKELGGEAVGSFILGFPWETIRDMKDTVKFAIKLNPSYAQFTVATPYPGTPLYDLARRNGLIADENWSHYTTIKPVMKGYHFSLEDISRVILYAYSRFYLRLGYMFKQVKKRNFNLIVSSVKKLILSMLSKVF